MCQPTFIFFRSDEKPPSQDPEQIGKNNKKGKKSIVSEYSPDLTESHGRRFAGQDQPLRPLFAGA